MGGELFTDYSDHPRQTGHAKPKTLNQRARTAPASFHRWWDAYRGNLAWKTSRKVGLALQQIKERDALPMIVDIRQAIDRCSNLWASLPGAGYGQFRHKADSLIANSSGRNGQRRLMPPGDYRDYLRSGYLHHRLPVAGC